MRFRYPFGPIFTLVVAISVLCSCEQRKSTVVAESPPLSPNSRGPTPTEKQVFAALALDTPGMEKVRAAIGAADYDAAKRELAAYFRDRQKPAWRVGSSGESKPRFNQSVADAASSGRVVGGLVSVEYQFPDGNIDWTFNATQDQPGVAFNPEWQWQLNRMAFWWDMANAYRATGDEKYARAISDQIVDWVADCPVPATKPGNGPSSWRTIEAGIRMGGVWADAFYSIRSSPSFSDDALLTMLGAFLDHARYLRANQTTANWLTMEMSGLYTVGALFPEFTEAGDWRTFAVSTISGEISRQFLPDGGHVELTPAYHNVALDNMLMIAEVAKTTGREGDIPSAYIASLERAYDYNLSLLTPDWSLPRFNDSWPVGAGYIYKKAVRFFPARQDFLWALTAGKQGQPPAAASRFLPWSGSAIMRSAWGPNENYFVLDVGPLGYGHTHQDKLNVVLWAWGRELLFDNGGGSYERSKWRTWALSTASHNCVLVDGLNQNVPELPNYVERYLDPAAVSQKPIDAGWISTPVFDYAKGVFDQGFGPQRRTLATQYRQVLFLKPDIFLVADRLVPNDDLAHTYQARWQLKTTTTAQNPATGEVVTTDPGLANLAIVPLRTEALTVRTASAEETPEILGWNPRKDETPPLLPATTVLHTRKGMGEQRFLTLLLPLKPGQASPVTRVVAGKKTIVTLSDGRQLIASDADQLSLEERLPNGSPGRSATGAFPLLPEEPGPSAREAVSNTGNTTKLK